MCHIHVDARGALYTRKMHFTNVHVHVHIYVYHLSKGCIFGKSLLDAHLPCWLFNDRGPDGGEWEVD